MTFPIRGSLTAVTPQTRCLARGTLDEFNADGSLTYTTLTVTAVLEHSRHSRITTTTECRTAILRRQPSCVGWRYRSASCVAGSGTCNWDIRGDMRASIPDGTVVEARLNGALIGTFTKVSSGSTSWRIAVNGSTVVPVSGDVITVEAVGEANALITDYPVDVPSAVAVNDTIYLTTMDGCAFASANGVLANDLPVLAR